MKKVAVIGAGVAGVTTAHLLQEKYAVTLMERDARIGGHTNTVILEKGPDAGMAVDTGFIVLNNKTYPLLHRLLNELDCPVRESNMSFGFYSEVDGFSYAGTDLNGLFAQRRNIFRPDYYRFLAEIVRFGQRALKDLEQGISGNQTFEDYTRNVHPDTVRRYIVPMAAAIWSATPREIFEFPASSLLAFWRNHGLLSLRDRPVWQTVKGGSHAYLKSFQRRFKGAVRTSVNIQSIERSPDRAGIRFEDGQVEYFDAVVLATHADQSLKLLAHPTPEERELLGAWSYQRNRTLLHTDESFLPANRRAWASWNYTERKSSGSPDDPVPVSYWMNLLQGLETETTYVVTLNPDRDPRPDSVIKEIEYHHPVYTRKAVASQARLDSLQGLNACWFCGSYFGHGFHEDAVRSAFSVARQMGVAVE